jgi:hypothetical protein
MRLVFIKCAGKYDRLDVFQDGGEPSSIPCPKQRIIPHDMIHYAVEATLGKRGFLARIRGGEAVSFYMQQEAESDSVERLVEVFQGDGWSGGNSDPRDLINLYRVTCEARGCAPMALDEDAVLAVRRVIEQLSAQWESVAVGGRLSLEY